MIDLKHIRKRCEAASKGPWKRLGHLIMARIGFHDQWERIAQFLYQHSHANTASDMERWNSEMIANSDLIAHARQDLPDCIAEIERLQKLPDVLETIKTKHGLLTGLSTYGGSCKCKGSVLCMKHAAADILKMIDEALEDK